MTFPTATEASVKQEPASRNATSNRDVSNPSTTGSLDRTLNEIRSSRRLEKIVDSIESFLQSQVTRLEGALDECRQAEENDRIIQGLLADAESEREAWEKRRQMEILRLEQVGEKLAEGWKQLEDERRNWMDHRDGIAGSGHSESRK